MLRTSVLLGLVLAAASPASAQVRYLLPLETGDEIRLALPDSPAPVAGHVVEWDSYMLSFAVDGDAGHVQRIDPASIGILEVRERSRTRSALRGAAWGLFLGGSAGLIAGPFAAGGLPYSFEGSLAALSAGGGLGGALIGATIGAAWAPHRWRSYVFSR